MKGNKTEKKNTIYEHVGMGTIKGKVHKKKDKIKNLLEHVSSDGNHKTD